MGSKTVFTFNNELGSACYFLASILGHTGVFAGVGQLDVYNVQFAIFAVRGELVLGSLAKVAPVFHP